MSRLRDTQAAFRVALLGGDQSAAVRDICDDGLEPEARLAIYRHHVSATLTELLTDIFPVVVRIVHERFFAYAADRFIATHPPTSPCLAEYGAAFADFLSEFEPCRHLAYLPDVARLEWAMSHAADVHERSPLDPRLLTDVEPDHLDRLTFRVQPSCVLLRSDWPIDRIWRANQPDAAPDTTVDLADGPAAVQVWRREGVITLRTLGAAAYAFRLALTGGSTLGVAATIARSVDPTFDLVTALRELFGDEVLVSFTLKEKSR